MRIGIPRSALSSRSRLLIICSLIFLIVVADGQTRPLRFPESRSISPGKIWLGWSLAERTGFVKGFIVGHGDGFMHGCQVAEINGAESRIAPNEFDPCLKRQHLFGKQILFYEQFITNFYRRYSMDRDVPVRALLLQADEKTPDEVHQWLVKKPN